MCTFLLRGRQALSFWTFLLAACAATNIQALDTVDPCGEENADFWVKPLGDNSGHDWTALSGLAADPRDPNILYAVTDKGERDKASDEYLSPPRVVTIDLRKNPPTVERVFEVVLPKSDGNEESEDRAQRLKLDLEGIAAKEDGGFWLVSEGNGEERMNLLLEIDEDGRVEIDEKGNSRTFSLPQHMKDAIGRHGFEGVTLDEMGSVFVAFQKPMGDLDIRDGKAYTRIAKFDPGNREMPWSYVHYELSNYDVERPKLDTSTGLSELLSLGSGRFAVIERDSLGGRKDRLSEPKDMTKTIVVFEIETETVSDDKVLPIVKQSRVMNLVPCFKGQDSVPQQIEGLAITSDDRVFVLTDEDEQEDTLLLYLGKSDRVFEN